MSEPCLVISHKSGDEGETYRERLQEYADSSGVRLVYLQGIVNMDNVEGACSLRNIFTAADFVTYPSGYEGFGNALLEAVYWQRPVMVNRYPIYIADIEPLGFNFCTIDTFITPKVVKEVRALLEDEALRAVVVKHNYDTAAGVYSYENLERLLLSVIGSFHA